MRPFNHLRNGRLFFFLSTHMSLSALRDVWKIHPETHTEKLVLVYLADCQNEKSGLCCPSLRTIAESCDLCKTSVQRALKNLETQGILFARRSKGGGWKEVNRYQIAGLRGQPELNLTGCREHPQRDAGSTPNGMQGAPITGCRESSKGMQGAPITGSNQKENGGGGGPFGEINGGEGKLTGAQIVALDNAIKRGEQRLRHLRERRPNEGWKKDSPSLAEVTMLRAALAQMKNAIGVPL